MPNCLTHSSASLFADDTNFITEGISTGEIQDKLCADLDKLHQWLLANKLTLNMNKTEYMIIGSRQKNLNTQHEATINFNDNKLKQVHFTKTGVVVNENLSWKKQISNTRNKVSQGIRLLLRIKRFVPQQTLINVYNSMILPILTIVAWYGKIVVMVYLINYKKCKIEQQE